MIKFVKSVYGWISKDDDFFGHVLAVSHFIISATFYLLIVACHTVYPSIYFQAFVFICIVIIWLQHVVLRVCISTVAEKELTKTYVPSIPWFKLFFEIMHINIEEFANYFLTAETVCVIMFGLEMISKVSVILYEKYEIVY